MKVSKATRAKWQYSGPVISDPAYYKAAKSLNDSIIARRSQWYGK